MIMQRFYHLDGLRGLLAACVALSHIYGSTTGYVPNYPFSGSYLAVAYFFILSGFVLTHLLMHVKTPMNIFFMQRVLRLWPLHVVCVAFFVGVCLFNTHNNRFTPSIDYLNPVSVTQNVFFLMNIGLNVDVINPPSWSIGIELWVSAFVLPFLLMLRTLVVFLFAVVLYAFTVHATGTGLNFSWNIVPFVNAGLLYGIAGMALGSAAYRATEIASFYNHRNDLFKAIVSTVSIILIFATVYFFQSSLFDILGVGLFGLLLATRALSSDAEPAGRILKTKPIAWLGHISFSLYLSHYAVIYAVLPGERLNMASPTMIVFGTFALCIIFAAALHYAFELPIGRAIKRYNVLISVEK